MTKINRINGAKTKRKDAKKTTVRLRDEKKKTVTDSGGIDGMTPKRGSRNDLGQFKALAIANSLFFWVLFQVVFPIILIGLPVLWFHIMKGTVGAFEHLLGKGILLMFSGLLLMGVFRTINQARLFVREFEQNVGLDKYQAFILVLGIALLLLYAVNVTLVYSCELEQDMSKVELFGDLVDWTYVGMFGVLVAIVFSFVGMYCVNRALLLLDIVKVRR
jgi:hypothetical protein